MEKIIWSETLSVGVTEIDNQHQQLIGLINQLIEVKLQEKETEVISKVISKMANYIDYHFGTEEKYMTRFQYSDLSAHRNEHRQFIIKVFELRKQYSQDTKALGPDMLTFLTSWLQNHILKTDKAYSSCFRENGLV